MMPPVLPPVIPPLMEDTPEKTQTATNIRDMLEDVTREIEEETNYLDYIPRRNDKLEPLDMEVLGFSNFISMNEDQYSALTKVRNIVEQSLRQLSNHLVRQSCVDL